MGWRPRLLLLHQCRMKKDGGADTVEQVAGIEPAMPIRRTGVSPQHFTCGGVQGTPDDLHARSARMTFHACDRIVGRVGIEPTSGRFKRPLQSQLLLPTHRARRRSSCLSSHPLESNQDLSGFSQARRPHAPGWVIRVPAPAGPHVVQRFGFQVAPRRGRPPAGPRRFGDAAVLGPGFEPGSERFRAVRRAELDQPSMSVVIAYLVGRPGNDPGGSRGLRLYRPHRLP